ncbi:Retrovirus-related Pol polyprotein from transposon 412-like protein, partial [Dinothrombium tinctorium]
PSTSREQMDHTTINHKFSKRYFKKDPKRKYINSYFRKPKREGNSLNDSKSNSCEDFCVFCRKLGHRIRFCDEFKKYSKDASVPRKAITDGTEEAENFSSALFINIKVNSFPTVAVLDTGSGLSVISRHFCDLIKIKRNSKPGVKIRSINNEVIETNGTAQFTIKLGKRKINICAQILDTFPFHLLLGNDVIINEKLLLDFSDPQNLAIRFSDSNETFPAFTINPEKINISLSENVIVTPHTCAFVSAKFKNYNSFTKNDLFVFKPSEKYKTPNELFALSGFVEIKENEIKIPIFNFSENKYLIRRGKSLGYCSQKSFESFFIDESKINETKEIVLDKANFGQNEDISLSDFEIEQTLTKEENTKLERLISEFKCCFTKSLSEITPSNVIEVKIDTKGPPIKRKMYKLPLVHREPLKNILQSDKHKTAIITPFGLYEFNRLPQGLKISPNNFQMAMEQVYAPILSYFKPELKTQLHTDGSKVGIGSALIQIENNKEKVVSYYSRVLNSSEKNYSAIEIELLAIVCSIKRFHNYLLGQKFEIITDSNSLTYLMRTKDLNSRLMHWSLFMQNYDFTFTYRKGESNKLCDFLSRFPVSSSSEGEQLANDLNDFHSAIREKSFSQFENSFENEICAFISLLTENKDSLNNIINNEVVNLNEFSYIFLTARNELIKDDTVFDIFFTEMNDIKKLQNEDKYLKNIIEVLKGKSLNKNKSIRKAAFNYELKDGKLFRVIVLNNEFKRVLALPKKLIPHILASAHDCILSGGHL